MEYSPEINKKINQFLTSPAFAVIGASSNRSKFGNKVLRCYIQQDKKVYPVNPNEEEIEGLTAIKQISDLPEQVKSISIITPPPITEKIVDQAITKGIKNIWMQPGAQSDLAIAKCEKNYINVIANGPCILAYFGFHE